MRERDELTTRLMLLEAQVKAQAIRITTLEGKRPGRRAKPVTVSEEHVCGVEPDMADSSECPYASLYRRHNGCKGDACVALSLKYYADRRNAKEG